MGLENRDYLRDEGFRYSSGSSSFGSHAPICRKLIIITIVVYVAQMFSVREWTQEELTIRRDKLLNSMQQQSEPPLAEIEGPAAVSLDIAAEELPLNPRALGLPDRYSVVQSWLQLETPKVFSGQIWRLLTCAFCHDRMSPWHILFNMLFLWWFGPRMESLYGDREFLVFYLTSAVAASVSYIGLDLVTGDPVPMIGASGAVMAVTMLYACHFPHQTIRLFMIWPIEMRWLMVFYVILEVHPVLLALTGETLFADSVAHAAHLGGLAFGYFYAKRQFRLSPFWNGVHTWFKARQRGFKVVRPSASTVDKKSARLATEMDRILQKISDEGEASLTKAERKTLEQASRELRNRRS